ncbi:MAG TPA: DNA polymerase IV [Nitratifractor sp.]|nr:DNA polymerase IV [Nitratifractor sp.]HHD74724.1 DNA polymerase IV [Nitratifractor sp.]
MKIHLDLDCYFVSAERTRYPFLNGKEVVVAKSSDKKIFSDSKKNGVLLPNTGAFNSTLEFANNYNGDTLNLWREHFIDKDGTIHGIVITKSYEAKALGITTGMPLVEALRRSKNLIVIPSDHLFYQEISQRLKSYLEKRIPLLEQYSIDEFFGDLNGWIKEEDTLEFIAQLQDDILREFGLPISIGASSSKWIAKLLTDTIKPYGVKVVEKEEIANFTKDIPIEEFPGVGRAIYKKLHSYGIKTLGELQKSPSLLTAYGKSGRELYRRVCGSDNEAIVVGSERKSIGISRNFQAIDSRKELYRRVAILARYLSFSVAKLSLNPTTFYFKIKYEHGASQKVSISQNRIFNERFFIDLALSKVKELDIFPNQSIHYISMSVSNFSSLNNLKTLSLIDYEKDAKMQKLNKKLMQIREKYGVDTIYYGNEKSFLEG